MMSVPQLIPPCSPLGLPLSSGQGTQRTRGLAGVWEAMRLGGSLLALSHLMTAIPWVCGLSHSLFASITVQIRANTSFHHQTSTSFIPPSYLLNKSWSAFLGCSWVLWQHIINIWLLLFLFNFYLERLCCFKPNIYSITQPPRFHSSPILSLPPACLHQPFRESRESLSNWFLLPLLGSYPQAVNHWGTSRAVAFRAAPASAQSQTTPGWFRVFLCFASSISSQLWEGPPHALEDTLPCLLRSRPWSRVDTADLLSALKPHFPQHLRSCPGLTSPAPWSTWLVFRLQNHQKALMITLRIFPSPRALTPTWWLV